MDGAGSASIEAIRIVVISEDNIFLWSDCIFSFSPLFFSGRFYAPDVNGLSCFLFKVFVNSVCCAMLCCVQFIYACMQS